MTYCQYCISAENVECYDDDDVDDDDDDDKNKKLNFIHGRW